MNKIVVIGDIHGRDVWKKILEKESDANKFIFMGDYFDTHQEITPDEQRTNFHDILELKIRNPQKFVLLIGNHDFHYFKGIREKYSGFQTADAELNQAALEEALEWGELQMCYVSNCCIFTHAGVTKTWCEAHGINTNIDTIDGEINTLFSKNRHAFGFSGRDSFGDDITQSPIWVRPKSLMQDKIEGLKPVVGHTQVKKLVCDELYPIILMDTLGTSKEYLVIDGEKREIKSIE